MRACSGLSLHSHVLQLYAKLQHDRSVAAELQQQRRPKGPRQKQTDTAVDSTAERISNRLAAHRANVALLRAFAHTGDLPNTLALLARMHKQYPQFLITRTDTQNEAMSPDLRTQLLDTAYSRPLDDPHRGDLIVTLKEPTRAEQVLHAYLLTGISVPQQYQYHAAAAAAGDTDDTQSDVVSDTQQQQQQTASERKRQQQQRHREQDPEVLQVND